jgi:hypothetical protein
VEKQRRGVSRDCVDLWAAKLRRREAARERRDAEAEEPGRRSAGVCDGM